MELRDTVLAVKRENVSIKASQSRLGSQRRRANDIGKTEGKTASLPKQLDFTKNLLVSLEGIKDLILGLVLDKPPDLNTLAPTVGPASPSQSVCKIADYKDGALLLELTEAVTASNKAKLKELTIVWSDPSYRIVFEAICGGDNLNCAVGKDAMKDISEAILHVDKVKRKEGKAWENSENKGRNAGGWRTGDAAVADWNDDSCQTGDWRTYANRSKGPGGGGGKNKGPYPPTSNRPASFSGNAAPSHSESGTPSWIECTYCHKIGHHKDTCNELAAVNARNNAW